SWLPSAQIARRLLLCPAEVAQRGTGHLLSGKEASNLSANFAPWPNPRPPPPLLRWPREAPQLAWKRGLVACGDEQGSGNEQRSHSQQDHPVSWQPGSVVVVAAVPHPSSAAAQGADRRTCPPSNATGGNRRIAALWSGRLTLVRPPAPANMDLKTM